MKLKINRKLYEIDMRDGTGYVAIDGVKVPWGKAMDTVRYVYGSCLLEQALKNKQGTTNEAIGVTRALMKKIQSKSRGGNV